MADNNKKWFTTLMIVCVVATSLSLTALLRLGVVNRALSDQVDELTDSVENLELRLKDVEYSEIGEESYLYIAKQIDDFNSYLLFLRDHKDYTAFIVIKDIQGYALSVKQVELMGDMGLKDAERLLEGEYHSYIAVVRDGQKVCEQLGGDEDITLAMEMGGSEVFLESATLNAGDKGVIQIDGEDYSIGGRAFNIVLVRTENMSVVDSVGFDTHSEEAGSLGNVSAAR